MYVTDLFKKYCIDRHEEDKKTSNNANYNFMQDVFSSTELFDISLLDKEVMNSIPVNIQNDNGKYYIEYFKNLTLPFSNNFIKVYENKYFSINLFIREYNPVTITGCIYLHNNKVQNISETLSCAIQINTETGEFIANTGTSFYLYNNVEEMLRATEKEMIELTQRAIQIICNLPKYNVMSDTPNRSEYYPKIKAQGVRVSNRPIYYVISENKKNQTETIKRSKEIKSIGRLEFTYSFKVRGHWRRLNPHSIGKNRNGEYKVYGYTFVREYIKGEGELVKRVRVVK